MEKKAILTLALLIFGMSQVLGQYNSERHTLFQQTLILTSLDKHFEKHPLYQEITSPDFMGSPDEQFYVMDNKWVMPSARLYKFQMPVEYIDRNEINRKGISHYFVFTGIEFPTPVSAEVSYEYYKEDHRGRTQKIKGQAQFALMGTEWVVDPELTKSKVIALR